MRFVFEGDFVVVFFRDGDLVVVDLVLLDIASFFRERMIEC